MKTDAKDFQHLILTMQHRGAEHSLYIVLVALALNAMLLIGLRLEIVALFSVMIGICVLMLKWTMAPFFYVLIIAYQLFDPGFEFFKNRFEASYFRSYYQQNEGKFEAWALVPVTLIYLAAQLRLLGFWVGHLPARFHAPLAVSDGPDPTNARPVEQIHESENWQQLLGIGILTGVVSVAVYLAWYEIDLEYRRGEGIVDRSIALLICVVLAWLGTIALAGYWLQRQRRKLPSTQMQLSARMELQNILWQEHHREWARAGYWKQEQS
jgi:hypothetical protein